MPATALPPGDFYFVSGDAANYQSRTYQRLITGLQLAGAPKHLGRSGEFADQNRLSRDEVRLLMFGHRVHGRARNGDDERTASFASDAVAAMSGDWVTSPTPMSGGTAHFKDEQFCVTFGPQRYCGSVMRNPGGTRENENEFIWEISAAYKFS